MENKKLKLTISGKPKKSFKNFETTRSQGKHSVVIEKSQNKFPKKGSSFRPNKAKLSTKVQVNSNDFEKMSVSMCLSSNFSFTMEMFRISVSTLRNS